MINEERVVKERDEQYRRLFLLRTCHECDYFEPECKSFDVNDFGNWAQVKPKSVCKLGYDIRHIVIAHKAFGLSVYVCDKYVFCDKHSRYDVSNDRRLDGKRIRQKDLGGFVSNFFKIWQQFNPFMFWVRRDRKEE